MSSQMLLKATLLLLFGISFLNVLYLPSPLIMYSRKNVNWFIELEPRDNLFTNQFSLRSKTFEK